MLVATSDTCGATTSTDSAQRWSSPTSARYGRRLDEDTADEITRWHELSRYEPDEGRHEPEMPELVQRLAEVACSVASYTITHFDGDEAYVRRIRRAIADIDHQLIGYDLESGNPLEMRSTGDNAR